MSPYFILLRSGFADFFQKGKRINTLGLGSHKSGCDNCSTFAHSVIASGDNIKEQTELCFNKISFMATIKIVTDILVS